MLGGVRRGKSFCHLAAISGAMGLLSVPLAATGQGRQARTVTGVIGAVLFENDQYYVHGWGCQQDQRGSIEVHVYAGNVAGGHPPGSFAKAGTANLPNEPAVDRECHDPDGGKPDRRI